MQELFGPLSMRELENDQYIRKVEGYLPQANVAFIDEIFKANSAILNTLLTILNERLFDNGNVRMPVPLMCLVRLPQAPEDPTFALFSEYDKAVTALLDFGSLEALKCLDSAILLLCFYLRDHRNSKNTSMSATTAPCS